jgi:3-hydroxyacyl-[acyl-carrier-protein] dehydratase
MRTPDPASGFRELPIVFDAAIARMSVISGAVTEEGVFSNVSELKLPLSVDDIANILPHRYPFLLVDRVTELEPGKRAVGYKMVTVNEPHFTGHFPGYPLMPGVLILEALAQLGGIAVLTVPELSQKRPMLTGVDEFRFRGQVRPGDKLDMDVTIDRLRGSMGKGHGVATVDGQVVAEGNILFALATV